MTKFSIPTRTEVSENNQILFDTLSKNIGFVPNLYAYFAKNDTALGDYLDLQNRKSILKAKEKEVVNLVTSQINGCLYCQSAHTIIAQMNGISQEQILEIRQGFASFDAKIDALAKLTASIVENRGKASENTKDAFFSAGYSEANLLDVLMLIGDKSISNYIHNLANFPIDFPIAPQISSTTN